MKKKWLMLSGIGKVLWGSTVCGKISNTTNPSSSKGIEEICSLATVSYTLTTYTIKNFVLCLHSNTSYYTMQSTEGKWEWTHLVVQLENWRDEIHENSQYLMPTSMMTLPYTFFFSSMTRWAHSIHQISIKCTYMYIHVYMYVTRCVGMGFIYCCSIFYACHAFSTAIHYLPICTLCFVWHSKCSRIQSTIVFYPSKTTHI